MQPKVRARGYISCREPFALLFAFIVPPISQVLLFSPLVKDDAASTGANVVHCDSMSLGTDVQGLALSLSDPGAEAPPWLLHSASWLHSELRPQGAVSATVARRLRLTGPSWVPRVPTPILGPPLQLDHHGQLMTLFAWVFHVSY